VTVQRPQEQWHTLLVGAHDGYLTWSAFQENQRRLTENARAVGAEHRHYPPREGPALLQGLLLCGICGAMMSVRYHKRAGNLIPHYCCRGRGNKEAEPACQSISGAGIDEAIGVLVFEALSPVALQVSLAVQQEIQSRLEESDRLRQQHVERTRYEADLARCRYLQVDPNNRLVADELECDWNRKLKTLAEVQEDYERKRQADRLHLDEATRARILALATDIPALWHAPGTAQRERKRIVRLVIEDATALKASNAITLNVRFKGSATRSLSLPAPQPSWLERKTHSQPVVAEIDRLLDDYTNEQIASRLNQRGFVSACGRAFHGDRVEYLRRAYRLKTRYDRLRQAGLLTLPEIAAKLGVSRNTVKLWRIQGRLPVGAYKLDDCGRHMYENPQAEDKSTRSHQTVSSVKEGAL
jgi:hypothetical protein